MLLPMLCMFLSTANLANRQFLYLLFKRTSCNPFIPAFLKAPSPLYPLDTRFF
jgi:hypothetical protein